MQSRYIYRCFLAVGLIAGISGCDSLLQVENVNNISGEDILKPVAAAGLVNGTEALISLGFSDLMNSYSTVTDELDWSGSRDSYREHDQGNLHDPFNEFTDEQFQTLAQSRWMADETISILEDLQAVDSLSDAALMSRAHINRAVVYMYIGDMLDDFPLGSDRQVGGVLLGESGMGVLYDQAATSATTAIGIAQTEGASSLQTLAQALLARALHGRAVWNLVGDKNSLGYTPGNPVTGLAQSATASAAAVTALSLMGGLSGDWVYYHEYSSGTISNSLGSWVNARQEMKIGPTYATPDPQGRPTFDAVSMTDVIDATTISPILDEMITEFTSIREYSPLRLVSAREMQLIIAEHELAAGGDVAAFRTAINALRTLDGLTAYSGQDIRGNGANTLASGVALLYSSRHTNLFLQGRRLADHYRFSDPSPEWLPTSRAVTVPGTFLPIPVVECRANENIPDNC